MKLVGIGSRTTSILVGADPFPKDATRILLVGLYFMIDLLRLILRIILHEVQNTIVSAPLNEGALRIVVDD